MVESSLSLDRTHHKKKSLQSKKLPSVALILVAEIMKSGPTSHEMMGYSCPDTKYS